jgi:hypothetical protein
VIDVRVRDPDRLELGAGSIYRINEALAVAPGIDDHSLVRVIIHQQIAILLEGSDGEGLDLHGFNAA